MKTYFNALLVRLIHIRHLFLFNALLLLIVHWYLFDGAVTRKRELMMALCNVLVFVGLFLKSRQLQRK